MSKAVVQALLGFGAFVLLGALIMLCVIALRADGRPTYCYVQAVSYSEVPHTYYSLYAYRPWREDKRVGIFEAHEAAVEAASRMNCPLH